MHKYTVDQIHKRGAKQRKSCILELLWGPILELVGAFPTEESVDCKH